MAKSKGRGAVVSVSDRGWSNYWTNGPDQVHASMTEPYHPPREVRKLDDMTPDERRALAAEYGCQVADKEPPPPPPPEDDSE